MKSIRRLAHVFVAGTPYRLTSGTAVSLLAPHASSNNSGTAFAAWTAPTTLIPGNVKRITVRIRSTAQNLQGRRELVVSALKVAGN